MDLLCVIIILKGFTKYKLNTFYLKISLTEFSSRLEGSNKISVSKSYF